jgi:lipid II:glycine glycyltransferase (peptidoglycan interpeptide bridge formation enzyme)
MKQKTRYNVGLAQRKGVTVRVDDSQEGVEEYLRLTFEETTKRQKFYAHDKEYHRKMWKNMHKAGIAHLLRAEYQGETLATWVVFILNGVLYYPYGASSSKHRKVMASNLMMWEAIKFGQKMGCTSFDMWGSLGPNPDKNHSWIGFHRFKEGYGSVLVESAGTFDYVINQPMYKVYEIADKLRWGLLRLRAMLPV